jgi:hypothetical protein
MQIKVACLKHCTREQVSSTVPPAVKQAEFFLKKDTADAAALHAEAGTAHAAGLLPHSS